MNMKTRYILSGVLMALATVRSNLYVFPDFCLGMNIR